MINPYTAVCDTIALEQFDRPWPLRCAIATTFVGTPAITIFDVQLLQMLTDRPFGTSFIVALSLLATLPCCWLTSVLVRQLPKTSTRLVFQFFRCSVLTFVLTIVFMQALYLLRLPVSLASIYHLYVPYIGVVAIVILQCLTSVLSGTLVYALFDRFLPKTRTDSVKSGR